MRFQRGLAIGIAILASAAPLLIGSVHPVTQVALSSGALLLCLIYAIDRRERGFHSIPFLVPAVVALIATVVQLVPLPAALMRQISPAAVDLRFGVAPSAIMPITLDVDGTLIEVVKGFACCGLLIVATSVSRSRTLARQLAAVLAMLAAGVAVVLFLQRALSAKAILGIYQPHGTPANGVAGTFVDGNHAASLFALGTMIALGLASDAIGGARVVMISAAAFCAAGLLSTGSRSGAAGLALGGVVYTAVVLAKKLGRSTGILFALLLVAGVAAGALQVADGLRNRIEQAGVEGSVTNQKTHGWQDAVRMTEAYAWTGGGRGAFEGVVQKYRHDDEGVRLVYAESLPLQAAADWGVPVAALLLLLVLWSFRQVIRQLHHFDDLALGAGCGVLAVLTHELADFGLEFPGVAFPTVVALGLVLGRLVEKDRHNWTKERVPFAVGAIALVAWAAAIPAAAMAVPHTVDADWEHCKKLLDARETTTARREIDAAIKRHPAVDYFELLRAQIATDDAIEHANRALQLHPANPLGHAVTANLLLRTGHRQQAALEYRLAGAPLTNDLLRALGDDAVDASPQTGEALLRLARNAAQLHRGGLVQRALIRAIDVSPSPDEALPDALKVADQLKIAPVAISLAQQLVRTRPEPSGYAAAAQALANAGRLAESEAAIASGLADHPGSALLILTGARVRYQHADFAGARAMLRTPSQSGFTLAQRKMGEELLADIDDRVGDSEGARAARARARLFGAKLAGGTNRP